MNSSSETHKNSNVIHDFSVKNILIGIAIGTANVIPGVSGGTMAVITGVFERLLLTLRAFNLKALKLLINRRFSELGRHVNFSFVMSISVGMIIAVFSMARLFGFLFDRYPVIVWAFFFGLIAPSVYYMGRSLSRLNAGAVTCIAGGAFAALALAFLSPAIENSNPVYVFMCGVVAISAMILPGISGSFVLILMGNYQLIVIKSIGSLDLAILIPFGAGCAAGVIAFAHLLSFFLKRFRNSVIALLTGFVAGSLFFVWPWKNAVFALDAAGQPLLHKGAEVALSYYRYFPKTLTAETVVACLFTCIGAFLVVILEKRASRECRKT